MIIEIPDHYASNIGGALVERAVSIINQRNIVPAYLHQYADAWDKGLHFGGSDTNFWTACYQAGAKRKILEREGLL